jgi:uncharacterized protein with HEPN domain
MRDETLLLIDIVEHARLVHGRIQKITRAEFDADIVVQMGIVHLLQIIGEAASKVSEPTRAKFPQVPWNRIVGMRHRIVHEYFRVDPDLIWRTASDHVPPLLVALEPIIGPIIDKKGQTP